MSPREGAAIEADVETLKRDVGELKSNDRELFELVRDVTSGLGDVKAGMARIEGSLQGALQAKRLSWPVILALISLGGTALVAVLLHLARGG